MSILFSGLFVMYRFMHKLANAVFSWFNLNWLRLDWRWSRRNYVHAAKEGIEKRVPNWSKPEMRSSWPNGIFERLLEVKNIPALFFLFKSWHPYKAKETLDHSPPPSSSIRLVMFFSIFLSQKLLQRWNHMLLHQAIVWKKVICFLNDEFDVPYQKYLDPPIFRIFCLIYLITRCKAIDKKCGRSYGISVKAL